MDQTRTPIPFNKPFLSGKETDYIRLAVQSGKISGNGYFTKQCHDFLEGLFRFPKTLLTSSCTDALEMAAILLDIQPGDEVIAPSYTFVSTVNAFVLRGAKIVFADSAAHQPHLDLEHVEELITPRTKAIVCVHYAGIACDMDPLMALAGRHGIAVVEDAAHAINSTYKKDRFLGGIGTIGAFSFHETKNIISGEGGAISINHKELVKRAEIVWEKGTNRAAFSRGETNRYNWVDIGSSFLPSEITAAFLFAQLEKLGLIQERRLQLWNLYEERLSLLAAKGFFSLPVIPGYASNNAHIFYLVCRNAEERDGLLARLHTHQIHAVFHYLPLHRSPYYAPQYTGRPLVNTDRFADCLLRLPMYYELQEEELEFICSVIAEFYG